MPPNLALGRNLFSGAQGPYDRSVKQVAAPSIPRHFLARSGMAALLSGIILGMVLLPAAVAGGPLSLLLALPCGVLGFAACAVWVSGSGADLQKYLSIGVAQAAGVLMGFGGCFLVLGGSISERFAALLMLLFALGVGFSCLAAALLVLLLSCAKACNERRRVKSRGVSVHRARRTKPQ